MGEWVERSIDEIAEVVGGGTPSTKEDTFFDGDIPWIRPADLSGYPYRYIAYGSRNISEAGLKNSGARILPAGTVLLTTRAPVGYVAIAEKQVTTNQGFRSLILRDGYSAEFVYYLLRANRETLEANASGSTFAELPGGRLKQLRFMFPPLDEQRRIAEILGSLDDKIELNRRMNQTLEDLARAIFKSWFVDFDPVKAKLRGESPVGMDAETAALFPSRLVESELGLIPEGWGVSKLGEVCENFDSRRVPLSKRERDVRRGEYRYYGAASVMDYIDDYLFDGIYLLMAEDGSVTNVEGYPTLQYVWGQFWVNNHAHVLRGTQVSTEFLMLHLKNTVISPYVTGAVQPKLNQKNMNSIPTLLPRSEVLVAYDAVISPLFELTRHNADESAVLVQGRDALLSKLMSGDLLT